MSKVIDRQIQDMLEQAQSGTLELIPCSKQLAIDDPVKFGQELDELRKLNGLPVEKNKSKVTASRTARNADSQVAIRVSAAAYARINSKAKRAKLSVSKYLEKLAGA